jgi:WD40 repeat protein
MKTNVVRRQRVIVWLGVACLGLVALRSLSAQEPKLRHTLQGHQSIVSFVVFSPDCNTLASGSHDKTIKLWEVPTGKNTATLQWYNDIVYSVAFSPDGKTLASGLSVLNSSSTVGICKSLFARHL